MDYNEAEHNYLHDLEAYARQLENAIKAIQSECKIQEVLTYRGMWKIEEICENVLDSDFFPPSKPDGIPF